MLKFTLLLLLNLIFYFSVNAQAAGEPDEESAGDESYWSAESAVKWMSNYQTYGIELNDGSTFGGSIGISHSDGFFTDFDAVYLSGNSEIDNWTFTTGYDYMFNDYVSFSGEYSYTNYSIDTGSVFSSLNHAVAFSLDTELPWDLTASLSFDHYFGDQPASYYGLSLSSFFKFESWYFLPVFQVTMVSQDIETRLLKNAKKGKTAVTGSTKHVTGLSNMGLLAVLIYPLTENLKLTVTPSYFLTPNGDLSVNSSQFSLSVGLKYGFDF